MRRSDLRGGRGSRKIAEGPALRETAIFLEPRTARWHDRHM